MLPLDEDIQLWEASAQQWIDNLQSRGDQAREFLDPRVWQQFGNVEGKVVLDVGCGEGRFCRQLAEKGAIVTGVEPTPKLLEKAKTYADSITYIDGRAEQLPFPNATFDFVLFYLVLLDVEPFEPALDEARRVLKTGGKCIVVNCTSMNTASDRFWETDENGNKTAWLVERYGSRHQCIAEWKGIRVHNYHRPLSTYFQAFLERGFELRFFDEPVPTDEEVKVVPNLAVSFISPFFNIHVWQKAD